MRFAAVVLSALLLATPAAADEAAEIRSVISGQIDAFRADDGTAAYGFAAPGIQRIFPNADVFMSMVRSGYQPVYRPQSVTFGRLEPYGEGFAQEVFVVGPDGEPYTALYSLERQPDGTLKISGCRIIRTPGNSV